MAIMTTLRERAGIIMVVAIVVAIASFVISDAMQSGQSFMQDSRNEIGEVAGESISYQDFDARLQPTVENLKNQMKTGSLDASMMGYAVDQTWQQLLSEIILDKQIEQSGVKVSSDELFDMVQGKNIHPQVRQAFTNPNTGEFDLKQLISFLKSKGEDPEKEKQWLEFEKGIAKQRLQQKYFNLIKGGLYVTKAEAQNDNEAKTRNYTINYVLADYATIGDSTVKVSESELESYYKANQYKFKQKEEQRSFDYVLFTAEPSAEDTAEALKYISEKAEELKASTNDSLFVALNAETKAPLDFAKKGTLSPMLDSTMFSKTPGYIYGPFLEGGFYKVAKLVALKSLPDSVKASHILIKPVAGNDIVKAKVKADSLVKVLKAGADFAAVAKQFSEDPGSGSKGGDLGYFTRGQMVKPFEEAAFTGAVGELQLVMSQFGYHIIKVTDQKKFQPNAKVAVIDRQLEPSNKTISGAYGKANAFLTKASDAAAFDQVALEEKMNKRIADNVRENDKYLAGLESPREVIRWAYKADKDAISQVFEMGNGFLVAKLTKIKQEGFVPLEEVKQEVEAAVRKENKGKMLTEQLQGAATLEDAAKKINGRIDTAASINFAYAFIPGVAREPKVVGAISAMKVGQVSKPLVGERGVYLVKVTLETPPAVNPDLALNKMQILSGIKSRVDGEVFDALKDISDVKDFRAKFY